MKRARLIARWVLALFFVVAGANHFRAPEIYLGMMPSWLPWPSAMNLISGAAETLGGVGLLVANTHVRQPCFWGAWAGAAAWRWLPRGF